MYRPGDIVTLAIAKEHGEGEGLMKLGAGTCGMVVKNEKTTNGEYQYIVEFGVYGQWYCTQAELGEELYQSRPEPERDRGESFTIRQVFDSPERSNEITEDEPLEDEMTFDDKGFPSTVPVIDFEKDLQKRMATLQKGT